MTNNNAELWEKVQKKIAALRKEIACVIVGQEKIVEQMLVALLCKGHCLIVGVPGLAKTLLVSTLGQVLGLAFRRIQFTPDLMPMDIIGSEILQESESRGRREFEFSRGPIFANLILADEINRTPPKTQAALLEAMQEKQVTVSGKTMTLEEPFIVYATQNPIEHEGTYPLPEAQLDRFFFNLLIDYPPMDKEREIVIKTTGREELKAGPIMGAQEVMDLQQSVLDVPMPDNVLDSIIKLAGSSRPNSDMADDYITQYVAWGAGPRASQNLTRAAKAMALLRGNPAASIEEVRDVAKPILRHRVIPNYNATGEGVSVEMIVEHLLESL
ncbi:AAA family ATPase [Verrucomicrobiota bacterium]